MRGPTTALLLLCLLGHGCPSGDDDDASDDDDTSDDDDDDDDDDDAPTLDEQLTAAFAELDDPPTPLSPVVVDGDLWVLGQALFFDPILSGNKDTACASCHHPEHGTSDGLHLTLGTGASGRGPERADNPHEDYIPRHAIDLFNRGDASIHTLFWDGKVEVREDGIFTPAGMDPLPEIDSVLAAQAMIPVLDPLEMRGWPGDVAVDGSVNEIAAIPFGDPAAAWEALMARLLAIPGYVDLFEAAFPSLAQEELTFAHAANAIAAYEAQTYSFTNSPWDRYLRGELDALGDDQKLGARLFFGVAGCGTCHSGALLSDQQFHATGVVQIGPGKQPAAPYDWGREHLTQEASDHFAFRTPPLRNLTLTAPYMHNGSLTTLEEIVVHYSNPQRTAEEYDPAFLHPDLQGEVHQDAAHIEDLVASLSPELQLDEAGALTIGLNNLRAFLVSLTDPAAEQLPGTLPSSVPSGLDIP